MPGSTALLQLVLALLLLVLLILLLILRRLLNEDALLPGRAAPMFVDSEEDEPGAGVAKFQAEAPGFAGAEFHFELLALDSIDEFQAAGFVGNGAGKQVSLGVDVAFAGDGEVWGVVLLGTSGPEPSGHEDGDEREKNLLS